MPARTRLGPPVTGPAQELIDSGFTLENADAPLLHDGLNLADLAHVIDLHERNVIPPEATRALLAVLLQATATPAASSCWRATAMPWFFSSIRLSTTRSGSSAMIASTDRSRLPAPTEAIRSIAGNFAR